MGSCRRKQIFFAEVALGHDHDGLLFFAKVTDDVIRLNSKEKTVVRRTAFN